MKNRQNLSFVHRLKVFGISVVLGNNSGNLIPQTGRNWKLFYVKSEEG